MINRLKRPLIIAEIGNNHEGSFQTARKLVHEAAKCKVDAIKFQTFSANNLVNKENIKRFKQLKKFELSNNEFIKLFKLAKKFKLKFISTPFDVESANFLGKFVDMFKISSGDNDFYLLIESVLKFRKPTIISTGFMNSSEIQNLIKMIKKNKFPLKKLTLLHCISDYPAKDFEANLKSISYLKKKFKINIGYSDHTIGIIAPIIATTLGAKIIEKHFTLNKRFSKFRDHYLSADPKEMRQIVESVTRTQAMLGKYEKKISPSEKINLINTRRSIYANGTIQKDETLNISDLKFLRPRMGISPNQYFKIIKKKTKKIILKNSLIKTNDLL